MEKVSIYEKRKELVRNLHSAVLKSKKFNIIDGKNKTRSVYRHHYVDFVVDDIDYRILVTTKHKIVLSMEILFSKGKKPKTKDLESIIEKIVMS
jgi:hypothetical protein